VGGELRVDLIGLGRRALAEPMESADMYSGSVYGTLRKVCLK